jgi:hypothetical protein
VNLTLASTDLNGSIPDRLTTLPKLQLLDVSYNNLSGVIPKFSSKVKLNTTGNLFQKNTTGNDFVIPNKSIPVIWIAGMILYSLYISISNCFVLLPFAMCKPCYLFILISILCSIK